MFIFETENLLICPDYQFYFSERNDNILIQVEHSGCDFHSSRNYSCIFINSHDKLENIPILWDSVIQRVRLAHIVILFADTSKVLNCCPDPKPLLLFVLYSTAVYVVCITQLLGELASCIYWISICIWCLIFSFKVRIKSPMGEKFRGFSPWIAVGCVGLPCTIALWPGQIPDLEEGPQLFGCVILKRYNCYFF